jgi:tricorn protease
LWAGLALLWASVATAAEPIQIANHPALSPDGKLLAFDWHGDIWVVPSTGGTATALTAHPSRDRQPHFSPDGQQIAFISEREGTPQVFVMPSTGGTPKQITFHTAGFTLAGWAPDGKHVLVSSQRDHFWRHAQRFFLVNTTERTGEELLFDDYGDNGQLSADGRKLLFTREGTQWWRKNYHGSQASQVWMYDRDSKVYTQLINEKHGGLWPLWKPDGTGFYYVGGAKSFNLFSADATGKNSQQLTRFADDSVVMPCISRDGSTLAFRHLFDLYIWRPNQNKGEPQKLTITRSDDHPVDRIERRTLRSATAATFTNDGLEIALVAGGDVWVMDTELREPVALTRTPSDESEPIFTPDGQSLYFISEASGASEIWKATRTEPTKFWWLNTKFKLEKLTSDGEVKSGLSFSPDGKLLAYLRGRGDLWVSGLDGQNARKVIAGWNQPDYDWSPDSKWLVYAQYDNDFNRDIWLQPLDGSKPRFNLSRHPYNDGDPVWSPDGKAIAFTGEREDKKVDLFYVFLRPEEDEQSTRDRTLEKALEKMNRSRPTAPAKKPEAKDEAKDKPAEVAPAPVALRPRAPDVVIDFDKIHDRIRRVSIPDSTERNLFWAPDGKRLAFEATVGGARGTYYIDIGDVPTPKQLSSQTGANPKWLKSGQIVWLANGLPASISAPAGRTSSPTVSAPAGLGLGLRRPTAPAPSEPTPSASSVAPADSGYRFTALQEFDLGQRYAAAFDVAWRTMRDNYYDEKLGNRDWNAVRAKYAPLASQCPDTDALGTVINLMLGELNGSHLGFFSQVPASLARSRPTPAVDPEATATKWTPQTVHLGVRFVDSFAGPGLRVRDVLAGGPAAQKKSRLQAGDTILSIDGKPVSLRIDLTTVLNGPVSREVTLQVKDDKGAERTVSIRPITYVIARRLLYDHWLEHNRQLVSDASKGTLGYLHISAMDTPSLNRFFEELYRAGAGKDGLVIDVRENGGGSTADHLLTALTQPVHAIAVPRGGGPGYPQDRTIYATWNKPIVVLCNQNSYSNAEIFSHAIKTLKRGQLVGIPTAGGVISTGGTMIMDVGFLRMPFRGWYLVNDGQDMELNGAVPDHKLWIAPGLLPAGTDPQIAKAVEVLLTDVKNAKPKPTLKKALERE